MIFVTKCTTGGDASGSAARHSFQTTVSIVSINVCASAAFDPGRKARSEYTPVIGNPLVAISSRRFRLSLVTSAPGWRTESRASEVPTRNKNANIGKQVAWRNLRFTESIPGADDQHLRRSLSISSTKRVRSIVLPATEIHPSLRKNRAIRSKRSMSDGSCSSGVKCMISFLISRTECRRSTNDLRSTFSPNVSHASGFSRRRQ